MPTPLALKDGHLTPDQIAQYWRDGFLFPIAVMPPQEATALRAELEQIEHNCRDNGLPLTRNTCKRVNSQIVSPLSHHVDATPDVAHQIGEKDYAMLVRGVERTGNFITFTSPRAPFTAASLALYDEIRAAQAQATMAGTDNKKGLYA